MRDAYDLRRSAEEIYTAAIKAADPYGSTLAALEKHDPGGEVAVISLGKAAVPMARAAGDRFGARIKSGLVITKYGHTGDFSSPYFKTLEAAHPVADENSAAAAERALSLAGGLSETDRLIFLVSGGGSALAEKSVIPAQDYVRIIKKLLARGAEIDEINTLRRALSLIKGGRLAGKAYPAPVYTFALSDVLSNDPSVIASGPSVPETKTREDVLFAAEKYVPEEKPLIEAALAGQNEATEIKTGGYYFTGDIHLLIDTAADRARSLGFTPVIYSRAMTGEASLRASEMLERAKELKSGGRPFCLIAGGETTVTLKGDGLGGRNQEMALAAAVALKGTEGEVFVSVGSDGTDGPTDAAGGMTDGGSFGRMEEKGLDPVFELENNNSYYALGSSGDLIKTGPTGTNVNDLTFVLYDPGTERRNFEED